jgi:multiple antibiotic resistance protein
MDPIATFIFFFAIIDPIGTVPVFIAVTRSYDERTKKQIAVKATMYSALILVFFIIAGEVLLEAMDIPLAAFQIFGGSVLFLFALTMIFGESKPDQEVNMVSRGNETAIFPLAVPSIAGPGSILAAVLLTENSEYSVFEQAVTTGVLLLVLIVVLVLMLSAKWIHRVIGDSGASIISRIMGLIFGSVAVSNMLSGITDYFGL